MLGVDEHLGVGCWVFGVDDLPFLYLTSLSYNAVKDKKVYRF